MELANNYQRTKIRAQLRNEVLGLTADRFEEVALRVFRYQAVHNKLYSRYLKYLRVDANQLQTLEEIPFLPIASFKQYAVRTGDPLASYAQLFESSGTTGTLTSRHYVSDMELYKQVSTRIFEEQYGPLTNYHLLALLPSYLERNNSSLVYMVQDFIEKSGSIYANFYLHDTQALTQQLRTIATQPDGRGVVLIGVTFALLDWADSGTDFSFLRQIPNLIVMETGGMKGRRKEMLREEVHAILTERLGIDSIHSEYGMTELLSQGYSKGEGLFEAGSTMRVLIRDPNDPFCIFSEDKLDETGGINVIDLANIDSCAFIETQDLGRYGVQKGTFYVVGRFDNSDIRGCNLMVG